MSRQFRITMKNSYWFTSFKESIAVDVQWIKTGKLDIGEDVYNGNFIRVECETLQQHVGVYFNLFDHDFQQKEIFPIANVFAT